MTKFEELDMKADALSDEVLEYATGPLSIANVRQAIRVAYKAGYLDRGNEEVSSDNLHPVMKDALKGFVK